MNKLRTIYAAKRDYVVTCKATTDAGRMADQIARQTPPRGFLQALENDRKNGSFGLIAELKKASPSKGLIREDFDPPALARAYQAGGATCLSILTDAPYFQGADSYLAQARGATDLPCLRKDFMIDPWQITQSRALGADAILLIMAMLDNAQASELEDSAQQLAMDVLIEVHDEAELERAMRLKSRMIGINNRDLRSFTTDISRTEKLVKLLPARYFPISESGIASHDDCKRLAMLGAQAFLVGEALMRHEDVEAATRLLLTGS